MAESKDSKEPQKATGTAALIAQTADKLKGMFANKITPASMVDVVTQSMLITKEFSSVDGDTKKTIVLQAIKMVIDAEANMPAETKAQVNLFLDTVAPTLIDTAVWIAKQKIDFNPKKWFPCC